MAPTTFRAEPADCAGIDWNDHASIRRAGSGGVFHEFKSLHHGTFAEMVALVARMNESERAGLVIEKAGDREFGPEEVLELYKCSNFPR
jgi:hypothetical protein